MWECKHRLYSVCHLGNLKAPSVVHDKVEFFFGKLGHPTRPEIGNSQGPDDAGALYFAFAFTVRGPHS